MLSRSFSRRSLVSMAALAATLMALAACETATPPKKTPAQTAAGTQAYVQNLTMAHLAYERSDEPADALPYVNGLNKYALKGTVKPMPMTAVMMNIKTRDDGKTRKLMVPVSGGRSPEFGNVRQVTNKLSTARPEYRNIQIRTVTLTTREAVPVSKARAGEVEGKMQDLYQTVYESAQTPPRLDAARVQIALTRFFMNAGIRDAAYVSLDNAKELLAGVDTSAQSTANTVQAMSHDLEGLENTLHEKLPYTF